jgi:ligand-binding sensor domain-containing protein
VRGAKNPGHPDVNRTPQRRDHEWGSIHRRPCQVLSFAQDAEGSLFVGTRFGLVRFLPDGRTVHYTFEDSVGQEPIPSLLYDDGVLWIGHQTSVFLWRPSSVSGELAGNHILSRGTSSRAGFRGLPVQPGEVRNFSPPGAGREFVATIQKLSGGRVWFSATTGVYEFSGGDIRPVTADLPLYQIASIREGSAGNIWLASTSSGVTKLERNGFDVFDSSDGLGRLPMGAVIDLAGEVMVPSRPRDLAISRGSRFETIPLKLPAHAVISSAGAVLQDHAGEWWIGTNKGLAQAIGQCAIQQGYKVLYRETHVMLLDELADAAVVGTRKEYMESVATERFESYLASQIYSLRVLSPHG